MARALRFWQASYMYHVIINTHNKEYIFNENKEKRVWLSIMKKELKKIKEKKGLGIYIIAYAIMSNHIHLLTQLPEEMKKKDEYIFSDLLRDGLSQFARKYNRGKDRSGAVFLDRAKVIAIEDMSYVKELIRYILMNPVRGGIVKRARYAKEGISSYLMTIKGIKGEIDIVEIPEEMKEIIGSIREELEIEMEESAKEDEGGKSLEVDKIIRGSRVAIGSIKWIMYIEENTKPWKKKKKILENEYRN